MATITVPIHRSDGVDEMVTGKVYGAFVVHRLTSPRLAAYPYRLTHWPTGRRVNDARTSQIALTYASDLARLFWWGWTTAPASLPETVLTLRKAWLRSGRIA